MENYIIEFLCSMRWFWIIVLIACYKLISRYINVLNEKNKIESDKVIKDIKIDESPNEELDNLINQILEEYLTIELTPKGIVYIKSDTENEIREYVTNEVTNRISLILLKKLEYKTNPDYVGQYIGKRIYFNIMNFIIGYNTTER